MEELFNTASKDNTQIQYHTSYSIQRLKLGFKTKWGIISTSHGCMVHLLATAIIIVNVQICDWVLIFGKIQGPDLIW